MTLTKARRLARASVIMNRSAVQETNMRWWVTVAADGSNDGIYDPFIWSRARKVAKSYVNLLAVTFLEEPSNAC